MALDATSAQLQLAGEELQIAEKQIGDQCDECDFIFQTRDDLYMHGYVHFRVPGLVDMIKNHRMHIMADFDLNTYDLEWGDQQHHCRSFNVPIQPEKIVTTQMIGKHLLAIRRLVGQTFKCRVGVSRVLQSKAAVARPPLKFFLTTHDSLAEVELGNQPGQQGVNLPAGGRRHLRVNAELVECDFVNPLHPYTISNLDSIYDASAVIEQDINSNMLNAREDSSWRLIAPTNLRFYCYLLDFVAGYHMQNAGLPKHIDHKRGIMDAVPLDEGDRNACALHCIARHFVEERKRYVIIFQ